MAHILYLYENCICMNHVFNFLKIVSKSTKSSVGVLICHILNFTIMDLIYNILMR